MDEGFRAQATQHTLVLEGTQITQVSWHLSQTDAFSGYIVVEFVSSTLKMSSRLFFSAIKTIPCQQQKCILCRLPAKNAWCKGKVVLHSGELLYFPTSWESKEGVSDCCKCGREIHPHRSSDSPA